jgi:Glycoside Hydrolase Family 113
MACVLILGTAAAARGDGPTAFERGVSLGLFAEDPGWSYRALLDEIAALGADHVELVVAWYQDDVAATEIGKHPRFTAPDEAVRRAVRDAHAAGLRVLLFPIVRLRVQHGPNEWRGTLAPRDRGAWFASYRARLLELARMATREGVEALSVGSELSTLDVERAPWEALVRDVRRVFRGTLVYSGNWDHFRDVAVYDVVDRIGLCGYFPLAEARDAEVHAVRVNELARAWRKLRDELTAFARAHARPIVFTEIGYLSQRGASAWPWDEGARKDVDLDEQRRAYEAFRRVWMDAPAELLAGVYFWNWYGWGGVTSRGYTPRGKPAAQEIRAFYGPASTALPSAPEPSVSAASRFEPSAPDASAAARSGTAASSGERKPAQTPAGKTQ